MQSGFTRVHPLLAFCYFMVILFFSMWFKQPLYLFSLLMFVIAPLYYWDRFATFRKHFKFYLIMALIVLVLNPLFYTGGTQVLFYLPNRSITVEGVLNGIVFSLSLLIILCMFLGYNLIITPQKFLYLFGNFMPKMAFILTIIMGFIPLFTTRMGEIVDTRRVLQNALAPHTKPSLKKRLTEAMTTLNTLVTWSLEASLDNAISMRARGYGTHKRTSSIVFTFDKRDYWLLGLGGFLVVFILAYSTLNKHTTLPESMQDWLYFTAFIVFSGLPLFIEMREHLRWRFMKSNT